MLLALDAATMLPIGLATLLGAGLVVSALANAAHAKNNEALADELDTAKEALDAASHALAKVSTGTPVVQALEELPQDPEAVDAFKKTLSYFMKIPKAPAALLLLTLLVGCTSPVTRVRIQHLEKSIQDERRATVVRPGFELEVSTLRSAEDADLAAIESASK